MARSSAAAKEQSRDDYGEREVSEQILTLLKARWAANKSRKHCGKTCVHFVPSRLIVGRRCPVCFTFSN